ncbi:hypothetical protein MKX03_007474 [Papaver bracteatum]|nr:hypothetical protein MKX03_007474 [Papaver bracteatum]
MNKLIITNLALFLVTSISKKHYIVYMGEHSHPDSESVISSNHDLLASVTGSIRQAKEVAVHHYSKSFRGFSAKLTAEQAQQLRESESVISDFESMINQLHTTHSWDFLSVDDVPQSNANIESKSDVIVGVIDSGIWPESESFNDNGLGPVPERFKGECVAGEQFTIDNCNRKIIGARYYTRGFEEDAGPLESQNETFFRSAEDAPAAGVSTFLARYIDIMEYLSINHKLIEGKIVVCSGLFSADKAIVVRDGGGVGMIFSMKAVAGINDVIVHYVIPTSVLDIKEIQALQNYVSLSKNPTARISPTTTILNSTRAPKMAFFSSVGPNTITPDIIKPDITAPGVRILAAWSPISIESTGGLSVDFNFVSGTSMACPHASAVAAMIKSHHPSWSPSAIKKSAIMTTANAIDNTNGPILVSPTDSPASPFNYGSGHVNPTAALDPGLVYEYDSNDIIDIVCATRANATEIQMLTRTKITCKNPLIPTYNLNYPSIGVANMNGNLSVIRTVTYYGRRSATFTAFTQNPSGVTVAVIPNVLTFRKTGERKSFRVRFMPSETTNGSFVFGSLSWRSDVYQVTSPIALNVASV